MKNTKLIVLLKKLSLTELRKFQEYVISPFFNKNKKVQQLVNILLENAPKFDSEVLEKRKVFEKIYMNQQYNELQINNVISDLLQLLYNFLAQLQFEQQPLLQKKYALKELFQKDAPQHFEKTIRRYRQLETKKEERSFDFFLEKKDFYSQLDQFVQTKIKRQFDENLQLSSDSLDLSYFINKLHIACNMISRNIVINANYHCDFLDEILIFCKKNKHFKNHPALQVYFKTIQMLKGKGKEAFYFDLKKSLVEHYRIFPKEELFTLYTYALNFCIKKINSGQATFYQEILELYKVLLDRKIIFLDGHLSQWTYKNIVTTAIRLKEFEWTENFIYTYQNALHANERNNALAYNLATLFHAQGDYRNTLFQLQNVEFTDTSYHLGAKILQLKSYYELNEGEAFFALIEAFKKYILRSKDLSDYRKKANANFIKLAKKNFQIKGRNGKTVDQKRKKIKEDLKNLEPIANKTWLLLTVND